MQHSIVTDVRLRGFELVTCRCSFMFCSLSLFIQPDHSINLSASLLPWATQTVKLSFINTTTRMILVLSNLEFCFYVLTSKSVTFATKVITVKYFFNPKKLKVFFWLFYSTLYCSGTTNFKRLYLAYHQRFHKIFFTTVKRIYI